MSNAALVNFAGGETSPKSRGRFDINSYPASCRKMLNFAVDVQGPARFRTGFEHKAGTTDNAIARMIPFHVSSALSYMLEFTPGKIQPYRNGVAVGSPIVTPYYTNDDVSDVCPSNNGSSLYLTHWKYAPRLLLLTALDTFSLIVTPRINDPFGVTSVEANKTTVTAIARLPKAVVTVASATGIDNSWGYITGIVGLTEMNYRLVKFKVLSGTQFYIVDPFTEEYISLTGAAQPWASGGSVHLLTIGLYNDAANIVNIERGSVTRITFPIGTSRSTGDLANLYHFSGIVGTTELNGQKYNLTDTTNDGQGRPRSLLRTVGNNDVDSSTWGAYVSGGEAMRNRDLPVVAAFHETRLVYGGTTIRPGTIFGSRATGDLGDSRFEDFTGGTNDDDAYFFVPASADGSSDEVLWLRSSTKYLLMGTLGGIFRVSGGNTDSAITPTSIVVRQIDSRGGVFNDSPVVDGARAFFIQHGGKALRGLRFNINIDDLEGYDAGLGAEHIAEDGVKRIAFQAGTTDTVWVLRDDGELAAVTVNASENITGWHRHRVGGTDAKVIDIAVLKEAGMVNQLWAVTSRTVNGATAYAIEILTDEVRFPDFEDFFTGKENKISDHARFRSGLYRKQEEYIHMDAAESYYGSDRGVAAGATLTPAAVTGAAVTFTASEDVFVVGDVGSELWKKPDAETGVGAGRAVITGYTSAKVVTCEITEDFNAATAIAAGDWYFAVDTVSGLTHLEGEQVAVVCDGAVYADGKAAADTEYESVVVSSGAISLNEPAAVIHVGLPYEGFLQTHNLELGGRSGPAQAKPRNIVGMSIRFSNTLGAEYGTDLYKTEPVVHHDNNMPTDRPNPVFSGIKKLAYSDTWSGPDSDNEKMVIVTQKLPLPCTVQFIDIEFNTSDE